MEQTIISGTNISVSRLSFGTASIHHIFSNKKRNELLTEVISNGITHFDTSPYYGNGFAENVLGNFLISIRKEFSLTTKIGLYPHPFITKTIPGILFQKLIGKVIPKFSLPEVNWSLDYAKKNLDASLKRLKTEYIDFLMFHEPQIEMINTYEFINWLEAELKVGRIRAYGVAGLSQNLIPFLDNNSPLAKIIQTKDSVINKYADFMKRYNRDLQFTYGYFSDAQNKDTAHDTYIQAFERNLSGSIIYATRRKDHLKEICQLLG